MTAVPVYLGVAWVTVLFAVLATLAPMWGALRLDSVRGGQGACNALGICTRDLRVST